MEIEGIGKISGKAVFSYKYGCIEPFVPQDNKY